MEAPEAPAENWAGIRAEDGAVGEARAVKAGDENRAGSRVKGRAEKRSEDGRDGSARA